MSADLGMDLKDELLPLVGGDALHEYPRWTLFIEFVTERDEGLGTSSDHRASVLSGGRTSSRR